MDDDRRKRLEASLISTYITQLTDGTDEEYDDILEDCFPGPLVELDCSTVEGYDDFFLTLAPKLVTDPDDHLSGHYGVNNHFSQEGGTLVLYDFDEMDEDTREDLAEYLKGLWEDINYSGYQEFAIALTADDTSLLLAGDPDLRGRTQTVSLD